MNSCDHTTAKELSIKIPCCHDAQRIPMRSISCEVKQLRIISNFWLFPWGRERATPNYIAAWKHNDYEGSGKANAFGNKKMSLRLS